MKRVVYRNNKKQKRSKIESEDKKAFKSGLWYTVSNFLTRSIVLITIPIFARILTTEEYGEFHVYANWQSLLLIICSMEFSQTINRARLDFKGRELKNYIGNGLIACGLMTVLLYVFVISNDWFSNCVLMLDNKYIYIMFMYLFFYPAFEFFQAEQRAKYKYKLSAMLSFISVLLGVTLSLFGALLFEDRLLGRIVGQYLVVTIFGAFCFGRYIFNIRKCSINYWKYGANIAIPLIFTYLGSQILSSSDKIVVQHMASTQEVAYIGIVTTCSHIMIILIQSLNNAWCPWLYNNMELNNYRIIRRVFKIYLLFVFLSTFGVILIGPELIKILGGQQYIDAVYLIPIAIPFCIFNLVIFQFMNVETYYKKTKFAAVSTGIVALLNIVLDILFVFLFGYVAVCCVTIFCYAILMFVHAKYVKTLSNKQFISIKQLCLLVWGTGLMILISYISYHCFILRITLLVFLLVIGVTFLKKVFDYLRNKKVLGET